MKRVLLSTLLDWKDRSEHLPLLIRGARQVGKTYLVEHFGRLFFENMVSINFELSPEYIACFATLKPVEVLNKIQILANQTIIPGKTLLFLDEIQECPNAIMALRYFKEQLPQLHVIGSGSLLEFAISQEGFSMPVGRVQYLYLRPLSFVEYLQAIEQTKILEFIQNVTITDQIPEVIHLTALKFVREYMILGGMPAVINTYINTNELMQCQELQTLLLRTYQNDFAKYASSARHKYLEQVYERTPNLVGQQIKYVNFSDSDPRYLRDAITALKKAGVIYPVYATSASGIPLSTYVNEKKFKLLFVDIGLMKRASKLDIDLLFQESLILLNRGAIAEQFVGQELLAYQSAFEEAEIHYWERSAKSSVAEVDYLIQMNKSILPIEVKAGKTGSLKSLHQLMKDKELPLGIRISEQPLEIKKQILSIPLYLVSQLTRLSQTC